MASSVSLRGVTSFASFSTRQQRQREQRKRCPTRGVVVVRASSSSEDDIENQKPIEKQATTTAETSTAQKLPLFDAQIQRLKTDIYALAATTSRGAEATDVQKDVMQKKLVKIKQQPKN